MKGRINSFQSMGAVDGPGVRFVIFMQGCPLRCIYCHNPETWSLNGEEYSLQQVLEKVMRYRLYFGAKGGVTISGGEPLLQWGFVSQLLCRLKEAGIHTALDTSGIGSLDGASAVLEYTDLVICDLKFKTEEEYMKYCKGSRENVLGFLKLTEERKIPLWIRHVVVPGLTGETGYVLDLARQAMKFSNLQNLELLPFRKLCVTKYDAMGIPYPLSRTEECPESLINEINREIRQLCF